MSKIAKIEDLEFVEFLSARKIHHRINELATEINQTYADKKITILVVMNGAFMFAADLVRFIESENELHFIRVKSYKGMSSTGKASLELPADFDLKGKDVLIIEDIVDTGHTMQKIYELLAEMEVNSIRLASLLSKTECRQVEVKIDYLAFEIPDRFVIGYGLDYNGFGRNLKDIYQLRPFVK
jgi:hypoxanthine phosphoribosyltransferase